ncbi:hypothetical protein TcasGA2_TC001319 [Tribolium castaneum]|uniref:Rho termination factor-like N-terminal domain-containing protein n=1 Tax=Tribolium castaneum TaxID=7070 RepID=D6WBX4_TRICA|nr:hypothetical protein TcasGA2_TC001319 [Tribolium castaneum]
MELSKDELRKMTLEEIIKLTKGDLKKVGDIIEQISEGNSSSNSDKSSSLTHESSSMDKYFLTPQSNNEIVLNKLSLKKIKAIAKKMGLKNYSQYNSKTKLDLIKLILKEELINAGDWFNKLNRLNIKKLKSIAEKLGLKIKQNSKKTDLVNQISDNALMSEANLNTVLKEIGSQSLEELLEETMSKNESTQNTSIKELRKIAKEKNITGYSKMKKAELLQKINDQPFAFEDSYFTELSKKSKIKIIETKAEYTKKWKKHKVYYKVILLKAEEEDSPKSDLSDIIMKKITVIREGLNEMIKIVKEKTNFKEGDLMNIVVNHPDLWNPISTGLSRTTEIDNLLNNIQSILTSNQDLDIYGCTFHAEVVNMPRGAGSGVKMLNIAEDSRTKKSITRINNKDRLCCPRAVIVGLTYQTNIILGKEFNDNDITYIRKGRNLQTTLAQELCNQLKEYNEEYFTLRDIANIEKVLNIQIKVIAAECFNQVIYSGEEKDVKVYLYKNGNHFDTINNMTAFYSQSYYCEKCDKPYQHKDNHKCKKGVKICILCLKPKHEEGSKQRIYCEKCNRYCFNPECLANHSEVCERFRKCLNCNKILKRGDKMLEEGNNKKGNKMVKEGRKMNDHRCGWEICRNCYKEVEILEHKCYMQWIRQKGGICETIMKDGDNKYKVKGCQNCDRKGCTVTFPDETNKQSNKGKETLSLKDLEKGSGYTITDLQLFTKDGKEKAVVILNNEFKLFLPDRLAKRGDELIGYMLEYDLVMTYNGLIDVKNNAGFTYKIHDITFKKMDKRPDKTNKYPDETNKHPDETNKHPDKTTERIKYHIYQCKDCKNCAKKPLDDEEPFKCVKCGSKYHTTKCSYTEKYLFFDYEAMQETGKHIANLAISHDFSGNVNSFETNEDFCKWLISRDHKGYTAIAHYSKGYDSYFILKHCVENGIKPFCVYNGSKIMLMEIKSINLRLLVVVILFKDL